MSSGGRVYWVRSHAEEFKVKGIVVVFAWISITDAQLKDFARLYTSLGWKPLVCRSGYLNPFIPDRATSLAFSVLEELVKELRCGLCPVVLASFCGGSKACMYKFLQIIKECSQLEPSLEDSGLVASCISGQIYDSDPVDFTNDLGARLALHSSILKMPGSSKLVSLFGKWVTSSLDALFVTRFGSQRTDYWQTLYSSVDIGAPFLILCSENNDSIPISTICNFAQRIRELGGNVSVVKFSTANEGQYKQQPMQYTAATAELLDRAVSIFSEKVQKLGKKSRTDYMHDEISDLICDLQNAAVHSNQSFRRVAVGPSDHFFLPSSSEYQKTPDYGSPQEESKDVLSHHSSPSMNTNSILGQILFDVCVPKNVEGWDIKFSGSLNGEPYASVRRRSVIRSIKHRSRL
ncbi:uncharacterized protein LOC127254876 [Andrographis paniculata]|uniref:uncharacterized protein LOC127254876 n=1 Tax=Andrographis paniculata TaxID=175694 RepID=UPI0021E70E24|nr:uncharacterized protein LOC127254876 [Andrographis paniculata]